MNKNIFLFILIFLLSVSNLVSETSEIIEAGDLFKHFLAGKELYDKAQYREAIVEFNKAIELSPSDIKPAAYLRIGYCYMALDNYPEADKVFDFIIGTYTDSAEATEALYQKARINFIYGKYEQSICQFSQFLEIAINDPLRGNAFFWIAESLYNLGHLDEASEVYAIVTEKHKDSYKYEAAKYRIELINLGKKERELVKLLKWNQEQYNNEQDLFAKKEAEYKEAILSYQKNLALLLEDDINLELISLQEANNLLIKQVEFKDLQIENLNNEIKKLKKNESSGVSTK